MEESLVLDDGVVNAYLKRVGLTLTWTYLNSYTFIKQHQMETYDKGMILIEEMLNET